MIQLKHGGPAFPVDANNKAPGMTLRDYFAAHAPIDMADARNHWHKMHGSGSRQPSMQDIMAVLALLRGEYADAMIAERGAE